MSKKGKSFEEIIGKFLHELNESYGYKAGDSVLKIALSHELFRDVMVELHDPKYGRDLFGSLSDNKIYGVELVARQKDNF